MSSTLIQRSILLLYSFLLSRLRIRLLILAVAMIITATLVPAGFRHPSMKDIEFTFNGPDFVNNVLLFAPLGFALASSSLGRAFLVALSLSTGIELMQLGYVDRVPSPLDILGNTAGAVIGHWAGKVWFRSRGYYVTSVGVSRIIASLGIPIGLFGIVFLVHYKPPSDFSNWSRSSHLAIGNELTGKRPWKGSISKIEIYPFAMKPPFDAPSGPPVFALQPVGEAMQDGRPVLLEQEELRFRDALVNANQMTLLVRMRPADLKQSGPARIVTYSQDAFDRNFTLGQVRDTLVFRLRTPSSGLNGTNPELSSRAVLLPDREVAVAAVYDGHTSRLYVDGKQAAEVDLGARRPHLYGRVPAWLWAVLPIRETELSMSEIFLSSLFTLGVFAITKPGRDSTRFLLTVAAGAAVGGAIWFFGVSSLGLGVGILLECIAAALVVNLCVEPQVAP